MMDKSPFSGIDKVRTEISTQLLKPLLLFIEKEYDRKVLEDFVTDTGLNLDYLENQQNWVSLKYFDLFLEKLTAFTHNPQALLLAGRYILHKDSNGYIYSYLNIAKLFANPVAMFKKVIEISAAFFTIGEFTLVSHQRNSIRIEYKLNNEFRMTNLNRMAVIGQLAYFPCFWGLNPATIKEILYSPTENACVYELRWRKKFLKDMAVPSVAAAVLACEAAYLVLAPQPLINAKDVLLTALAFAIIFLAKKILRLRNAFSEQQKLHDQQSLDLVRHIQTSRMEFDGLQAANLQIVDKASKLAIINYYSEKISSIVEEEALVQETIKILIESIRFSRGYCVYLDNLLSIIKEPVFYRRNFDKIYADEMTGLVIDKEQVCHIIQNKQPQIVASRIFFPHMTCIELLVIPVAVYKTFYYLLMFDNLDSGKEIKIKNMQFYSTIAKQVEISLNNIYSAKSARNILENIPSSIVVFDKDTFNISYVNSTYLRNDNVQIHKVLGLNIMEVLKVPEIYRRFFLSQIQDIIDNKFLDDLELQIGPRIIGYTLFKMPQALSGKNEIGMIMRDITERKQFQEHIMREEKLAALGTLASGIAHEINNPLYGIVGIAEVITDEGESEVVRQLGRDIIDFTMQCSDIVKDLSSYSRSLREEQPREIDVNDVIVETLRIIKYSPKYVDIKIEQDFHEVPAIFAMGGEIMQIYMNIINNAIGAMQGRGKLKITSEFKNGFIETSVEDSGTGIPQEIQSKIFDPFFTTKPPGEGTGIGLNIVYRLVKKYNGFVSLRSKEDKGAKFFIKFPVKEKT